MEALTAATVAALTVLDMLKSADPWMTIDVGATAQQERRPQRRSSNARDEMAGPVITVSDSRARGDDRG